MFLSAYHFDGEPEQLRDSYRRLRASLPDEAIDLQVCIERADGLTVLDACPDRATFEQFSASAGFQGAVAAAGLPVPRLEPLGDVVALTAREAIRR